jgi:FdhD protein
MPQPPLSQPIDSPNIPTSVDDPLRSSLEITLHQSSGSAVHTVEDTLAVEEPLEIQLAFGASDSRTVKSISVTMRTPGDDAALAVGFLVTEGIVREPDDIASVRYTSPAKAAPPVAGAVLSPDSAGNIIRVELNPSVEPNVASLERNFYTTSSCGICGKASLLALQSVAPPRRQNLLTIAAETVYSLPEKLAAGQALFRRTGGLHGAGLFDRAGNLQVVCEDVGRHNAVDKLLGREFLADRFPLRERLLMLSGRVSFELLQKAVMAGIPMVVAVGAPSSLAVSVARQFDITLIGFLRDRRFNIYNGENRILHNDSPAITARSKESQQKDKKD